MTLDCLVGQLLREVRLPVMLESWRQQSIEHALEHGIRYRAEQVQCGRTELPDRLYNFLCLLHRPGIAGDDGTHGDAMKGFRNEWRCRCDQEREYRTQVFGCRSHVVTEE